MSKPIILGAGLAGLTTALALAPMPVLLVSPRILGQGCSSDWSQGGIAAAVGDDDSADLHSADTIKAGAGLNDDAIVAQTTQDGHRVIDALIGYGVPFDCDQRGSLRMGLEAAHSRRRIVHARDATGHAIMQALIAATRATPSIEIIENAQARALTRDHHGIAGVTLYKDGQDQVLPTRQVILATGGAAALWRDTTNPHENWGSGLALAARIGACLGDIEFTQFHPTAIDCGRDPMPLASEALRGEGAVLTLANGERFTDELQPRDIVARAIWQRVSKGERVFLDARSITDFATRFPNIFNLCRQPGIDPTQSPIPVRPAAHYHMGGVVTDAKGRTNIPGLWACGEVACTGLHGANRLASNSLLEAASFGFRVAEDVKNRLVTSSLDLAVRDAAITDTAPLPAASAGTRALIRATLSDHVGVIRDHAGLTRAVDILSPLATQHAMALVGLMIAQAALRRRESRGAHFRSDFPAIDAVGRRSVFTYEADFSPSGPPLNSPSHFDGGRSDSA